MNKEDWISWGTLAILILCFLVLMYVIYTEQNTEEVGREKIFKPTERMNLTRNEKPYDLGGLGTVNRSIKIYLNETFCVESKDINSCYDLDKLSEFTDHKINYEIVYYVYINHGEKIPTIYIVNDDKKSNPFITASGVAHS